jgi:PPOX class probable F420-dependent enzyme
MGEEERGSSWTDLAGRLQAERTIWLATVGRDGAPHAAPVWLAVVDDDVYIFTSGATVKARNLLADPRAVLHSENGEDVVIVSGQLEFIGDPLDHPTVMVGFAEKYREPGDADFLPGREPSADSLFRLQPEKAMSWNLADFEGSQSRWSAT